MKPISRAPAADAVYKMALTLRSFSGISQMYSEFVLTAAQRLLLSLIEYGPATLAEAAASCRGEDDHPSTDGEAFRSAVVKLLCRGLIRPEGESLAITIAGRVALADDACEGR